MDIKEFSKKRDRDKNGRFIKPSIPSGFNLKEYRKKYHILNREHKIRKAVEWGRLNKERRKVIKKRWRDSNREKTNFLARLHIYRRKGAGGYPNLLQIQNLYRKYLNKCAYCKTNKATSIDHIVPIIRGGKNDIENLLPACVQCNSSKGGKLLEDWKPNFKINEQYA